MRSPMGVAGAVTALLWAAAWVAIIAGRSLDATTVRLLQGLAAITAAQAALAYLRLPRPGGGRARLVALPAVLALVAPSFGALLHRVGGAGEPVAMHLVYLVFPAGALAAGLLTAIAAELIGMTLRIAARSVRR